MVIQSGDANTATESDMATTLNMRDIHSQVRNPNNLSSKQRQRRMVRRDSYEFFTRKLINSQRKTAYVNG